MNFENPNIEEMIGNHLVIQGTVNTNVSKDWMKAKRPWYRASWLETAELVESTDWKWWKSTPMTQVKIDNLKIELVDIWHFILSELIEKYSILGYDEKTVNNMIAKSLSYNEIQYKHIDDQYMRLVAVAEEFVYKTLAVKSPNLPLFAQMMELADLSFEELNRIYLGKSTLNNFRQSHGYNEGTYIKQWTVKVEGSEELVEIEDNVVMLSIIQNMTYKDLESYTTELTASLEEAYPKEVKEQK